MISIPGVSTEEALVTQGFFVSCHTNTSPVAPRGASSLRSTVSSHSAASRKTIGQALPQGEQGLGLGLCEGAGVHGTFPIEYRSATSCAASRARSLPSVSNSV